jgi:hypothetical protein
MAKRLHVYDSWNIIKQKKNGKIIQFPSIKSPLFWYGIGFSLKNFYYYAFIVKPMQKKTYFWMKFHPFKKKVCMFLDQYHAP